MEVRIPGEVMNAGRAPRSSDPLGDPVDIRVEHGTVYVMSEKATGNDWMSRSKYRVVHGASLPGNKKYIAKNY